MLEEQVKLSEEFADFVYQHGKTAIIDAIIKIGDEAKAIERAEQILNAHGDKKPIEANPCTHVHKLVKHLRELIAWYSYTAG